MDYNPFLRYGWNVMRFYMNSEEDKRSDGMRHYNPMCAAFPTEVEAQDSRSWSILSIQLSLQGVLFGAKHRCWRRNSTTQWTLHPHPGIACHGLSFFIPLSLQNIINEKIYLVLWFWYAFLVPVSFIFGFYRLFTILCYTIRFNLLYKTVQTGNKSI